MTDTVVLTIEPAESARRYYKWAIADRSERWNVLYKALFFLDFCHHNCLRLPDDIWITPEELVEHIATGLKSGERNSRRAGNNPTADWFAHQSINFEEEIAAQIIRHGAMNGEIILDALCRIVPGAKQDLARHPAQLR